MYRGLRTVFQTLKSAYEVVRRIKQMLCVLSINYNVIQNKGRTFAWLEKWQMSLELGNVHLLWGKFSKVMFLTVKFWESNNW